MHEKKGTNENKFAYVKIQLAYIYIVKESFKNQQKICVCVSPLCISIYKYIERLVFRCASTYLRYGYLFAVCVCVSICSCVFSVQTLYNICLSVLYYEWYAKSISRAAHTHTKEIELKFIAYTTHRIWMRV